jgi:beta-galactosidase
VANGCTEIQFKLTRPALIIGDNPFLMNDNGGVGVLRIKSLLERSGRITLNASQSTLGKNFLAFNSEITG